MIQETASRNLKILAMYAEVTRAEYEATMKLVKFGSAVDQARAVEALRAAGKVPEIVDVGGALFVPRVN